MTMSGPATTMSDATVSGAASSSAHATARDAAIGSVISSSIDTDAETDAAAAAAYESDGLVGGFEIELSAPPPLPETAYESPGTERTARPALESSEEAQWAAATPRPDPQNLVDKQRRLKSIRDMESMHRKAVRAFRKRS